MCKTPFPFYLWCNKDEPGTLCTWNLSAQTSPEQKPGLQQTRLAHEVAAKCCIQFERSPPNHTACLCIISLLTQLTSCMKSERSLENHTAYLCIISLLTATDKLYKIWALAQNPHSMLLYHFSFDSNWQVVWKLSTHSKTTQCTSVSFLFWQQPTSCMKTERSLKNHAACFCIIFLLTALTNCDGQYTGYCKAVWAVPWACTIQKWFFLISLRD